MKKIPHTYVILFILIVIAAILTWIIPGGKYTGETMIASGVEKTILVFQYTHNVKQTWQIFSALFDGFQRQSGIIVFILLIGGAFWIMNDSKAIDVGILAFLRKTRKAEHLWIFRKIGVNNVILVMIMLLFSIFGAVFGMSEETIAFIIILVPLAIAMGYDSITGVAIIFVAAGLGFAGAVLNPFTIGVAQGISGLPLFSGLGYRLFCWVVINFIGIVYILRYAGRVFKNPERSPVFDEDSHWRKLSESTADTAVKYHSPLASWIVYGIISVILTIFSFHFPDTTIVVGESASCLPLIPSTTGLFIFAGFFALRKSVHFFILDLLMTTVVVLIIGVMGYKWYIMEIASLFFAMGIASGIAMDKSANALVKLFLEGVKDILPAALVVGLAGGIIIILERGQVIDTILHYLSGSMNSMGKLATISMMYVIQTLINIVIPSGSAKAALTMPIMAPFSDLIGLSRQATVMAYQFGDGFTNMIIPTSPVLIGVLGVARIPYDKWVKWIAPFMLVLILLGFLLLIPTVTMNLKGF